ncbi:MAG: SHOCT domain-containing protein [Lacrimispora saccharolytica]
MILSTGSDITHTAALEGISTEHLFTPEQFQQDVDYYRAQCITKSLLDSGLISLSQFNKLTALNRKSFSLLFSPKSCQNPLILPPFRGNMSHYRREVKP